MKHDNGCRNKKATSPYIPGERRRKGRRASDGAVRKPRRYRPVFWHEMRRCASEIQYLLKCAMEDEDGAQRPSIVQDLKEQAKIFAAAYGQWSLGKDCVDRLSDLIYEPIHDLVLWVKEQKFRRFFVGNTGGAFPSKMFRKKRPCSMCDSVHQRDHGCPRPRSGCSSFVEDRVDTYCCPSPDWRNCGHNSPPSHAVFRVTPVNFRALVAASYRAYTLAKQVEPLCKSLGELERRVRRLRRDLEDLRVGSSVADEGRIEAALDALQSAERELVKAREEAGDWTFSELLRDAGNAYREAIAEAAVFIPMPEGIEPEYKQTYVVEKANLSVAKRHIVVYGGWHYEGNQVIKRQELLVEFAALFWEHIVSKGKIFRWEVELQRQDVGQDPALKRIQSLASRIAYRSGETRWFANPGLSMVAVYSTVQVPKDPGLEVDAKEVLLDLLDVVRVTDLPNKAEYKFRSFKRAYGGSHGWEWEPHNSVNWEWELVGWGSSTAPDQQALVDTEEATQAGIQTEIATDAEISMRAPGRIRHTLTFTVPMELGGLIDPEDPQRGCYLYHLYFARDCLGLSLRPEMFEELRVNWLAILRAVNHVKRKAA